jgi:hypothetical protein
MTHKERLTTALQRGVPDQVPITWELEGRFAVTLTGRLDWKGICDAHRMIGSSIFNVQGIGPGLRTRLPAGYESAETSEPYPSGGTLSRRTLRTPKGELSSADVVGYMPNDPHVSKHVEYLIKDRSDWPIYADYIRTVARNSEPALEGPAEAYDYIGDDGLVGGWMADSVYHLAHQRRDQDFIMDLVEVPDLMEETLRAADEHSQVLLESLNASKIECLVYDICWSSLSLLSPALVRQFVIPRAKQAAAMTAAGKFIVFFQTGRIRAVVPDLVACLPHGIQHFDVLGDCDLAEIKQSFGQDICVIGNVSPVVLAYGSTDEARAEARRCLSAAKDGGSYIMSTSDEVPVDAKVENMKAMVEVVAAEGIY